MDVESYYKGSMENAYRHIEAYRKLLIDRGLLVENPTCGWHLEWIIRFEIIKNEALSNAIKQVYQYQNLYNSR